ncbi:MAG: CaiB/BaiF CoA transferase family protein [Pseudomonadales bacterium]|jgi:CoA:oxalate CoA-transferase|tara:strand:- start:26556 stop:27761 length:1206 start_codon:yes stop_codon:yes gene_type:complete
MASDKGSLAGITVLDLGQIYNGPYATFLMAMAGARVIKVESLMGETLRGRGETSAAAYPFMLLNQNKESLSIDLKTDQGKDIFRQLVTKADVVLENFSPDTMTKLGLSATSLLELNPALIYAAGSGYGRSGPHRDFQAMDLTVQAMSGVMSTTGYDGTPPLKAGVPLCDFFGGVHLYGAIVTALFERTTTGKGAIIDMAMQDTVLPNLASVLGAYYYFDQQVPARTGNQHSALTMSPYNVYEATDGHVSIICIRDGHWRGLLRAIGRAELLEDASLAKMSQRSERIADVDAIVSEFTQAHTRQEILDALQGEGVPTAMVRDVKEVLADEHMHERGTLRDIEHPVLGNVTLMNSAINVATGSRIEPKLPAQLGEQNDLVLSELLGMDDSTIQQLRSTGVISQ